MTVDFCLERDCAANAGMRRLTSACPLSENTLLSVPETDPLENLLIEHPSMSVYQIKCGLSRAEEEEQGSEEDEEETVRSETFLCSLICK